MRTGHEASRRYTARAATAAAVALVLTMGCARQERSAARSDTTTTAAIPQAPATPPVTGAPHVTPAPTQDGGTPPNARRVIVGGVNLTSVGYDRGNPSAPVVVVELSDFGCPYCGQFARTTYPALDSEYVRTGKVFFKYIPFVIGMFPHATEAARAAECAADQRRFWTMYERLYAAQPAWKESASPAAAFSEYAAAAGLDTSRFAACYAAGGMHPRTRLATDAANLLGVRATPSFLVNGRPIEGALPLAAFRTVLNAALADTAHGTAP